MLSGCMLHQHGRVAKAQTMACADSPCGFASSLIPRPCCSQDPSSEERFHVELHFSPGVKGCEEDGNVPTGFGFRPASAEVSALCWARGRGLPCTGTCCVRLCCASCCPASRCGLGPSSVSPPARLCARGLGRSRFCLASRAL